MKRILRSDGWDEVTTTEVRVTFKVKAFQSASFWVDHGIRHPKMNTKGRNHCERCGCKWADVPPETMTYFVMTNKGNKVLCESCNNQVKE
jgi:hypothetical protein